MRVDIAGVVDDAVDPGISTAALKRLDEQVGAAHERISAGRERSTPGYAALDLPTETDPAAIRSTVAPVADVEVVLTVGIGGSALGAATITRVLGGNHRVLDNVDPRHTRTVLEELPLERTAVHVASKSGTTTETLATWLVVREAMTEAGVDWTSRTVVTTGPDGPLREQANRFDLPTLDAPSDVPGRFSALSTVGLVPSAILGHDLEALLAGAEAVADGLTGSLFECPPYAYGAIADALVRRGAGVNAVMPYAESLEPFGEWLAQLWAESLGKDGKGQAPLRAMGATDQHSQLQRFRDGPRDTMVTVVRPRERPEVSVPATDDDSLEHLGGHTLGELLDIEAEATMASLAEAGRPAVAVEVDRLDAEGIGALLYGFEAACIMAGELSGVSTFDQPAVEWGKRATVDLLSGTDSEAARTVRDRQTRWIE